MKSKIYYSALLLCSLPSVVLAETNSNTDTTDWIFTPGILGTILLIVLVLAIGVFILSLQASNQLHIYKAKQTFLVSSLGQLNSWSDMRATLPHASTEVLSYAIGLR